MIALLLAAAAAFLPNGPNREAPAVCRSQGALQTSYADPALLLRPQDRAAVTARKLGDLPKANLEIAVLRSVEGCANPIVVGYEVERDGRFAGGQAK
jgi:hypothetical protein